MESQLIRLNNKLNRKRIDYIEIQGTCDKNGKIKQQFIDIMKYDNEYDHYITLTSAQFSSLFSNFVKDKNDNFYYSVIDINQGYDYKDKVKTFTEGANEVNNINAIIQRKIPNESIKLVIDQESAKCKIFIKQRYKIDFTRNDTFRDILEYDAVVVDQSFTKSP